MSTNTFAKGSSKIGGGRQVFNHILHQDTVGGNIDVENLPNVGNVLPAGTPLEFDTYSLMAKPMYLFKAKKGSSATEYEIEKSIEGSRVKVGMTLGIYPADGDLAKKIEAVTIIAVNTSADDKDIVTISAAFAGGDAEAILIETEAAGATADIKVKKPNRILGTDIRVEAGIVQATARTVDFCDLMLRRVPPIPEALLNTLRDNYCYVLPTHARQ